MIRNSLFALSLVLPLVAMSSAANAGQNNWIPRSNQASFQKSNTVYAQYVPAKHTGGWECRYQGGPKSPIVHFRRQ